MATNESPKIGVLHGKVFFIALPFRNGTEYRIGNRQLRSILNVATSFADMMIGGVTSEKRLLIFPVL